MVEAILKYFERVLRWVYPGALFMVLLYMSKPKAFRALRELGGEDVGALWFLVVAGVVAGVVIYLLQAYVLGRLIWLVLYCLKWDVRIWGKNKVKCCLKCLADVMDDEAKAIRKQFAKDNGIGRYLDYSWSAYHAMSITGWLTLVFYCIREKSESALAAAGGWCVVTPAVLLLVFSFWVYMVMTRVPLDQDCGDTVSYQKYR